MRPKYGNHKVTYQGKTFDSQLEMARYIFLANREREGEISDLKCQVEYELLPAQYRTETKHLKTKDKEIRRLVERPCTYRADFTYIRNGRLIVEDVKGSKYMIDEKFPIKKKMMLYFRDIEINIVSCPTKWEELQES